MAQGLELDNSATVISGNRLSRDVGVCEMDNDQELDAEEEEAQDDNLLGSGTNDNGDDALSDEEDILEDLYDL